MEAHGFVKKLGRCFPTDSSNAWTIKIIVMGNR